jgi:hypothetical protein
VPADPALPLVWAAATPSARNRTHEARKYLAMESPLCEVRIYKRGLCIGMPPQLEEMGCNSYLRELLIVCGNPGKLQPGKMRSRCRWLSD